MGSASESEPPSTGSVPYFKRIKSFADVPVNETGVETVAFLDASDGLVNMFDLLGPGVFTFVQADLKKNINGVREQYYHYPSVSPTLENLVKHEVVGGHRHATDCLLRLLRGLAFTRTALQNSNDDKGEELTSSFRRAYDTTLRHYHNFVVRTLVGVAIKACPRRHDFYSRIAQGGSHEELDVEMRKWLLALDDVLNHMGKFYETEDYGRI